MKPNQRAQPVKPAGHVLRSPWSYDLIAWLFAGGRPRSLRCAMLAPAMLRPRERVLDTGCGTGSLALEAKRQVGVNGWVAGIDASEEMIGHARRKAARTRLNVMFTVAAAQSLPFGEAEFEVVLSTLMLHHLPKVGREQLAREIKRVLKPGGRVLVVDFAARTRPSRKILHRGHGATSLADMVSILASAGLNVVSSGPLWRGQMHYVLARRNEDPTLPFVQPTSPAYEAEMTGAPMRELAPRWPRSLLVALAAIALVAAHVLAGAAFWPFVSSSWALRVALGVILAGLVVKLAMLLARLHRGRDRA